MSSLDNTKQITDLDPHVNPKGTDMFLVDVGGETRQISLDSMMSYIVNQINKGTYPEQIIDKCNYRTTEIPEGESLPISARENGHMFLNIMQSTDATEFISGTIKVSPNMALKIVND